MTDSYPPDRPRSDDSGMSDDERANPPGPDHSDEIRQMAAEQFWDEALELAGMLSPADAKGRAVKRAERIEQMDAERGLAPAKYAEFREAFEAGAGCAELFEIRNRMEPKDPLKVAAK